MTFLFSESGDADFFDSWLLPPWMLDRAIFRSDLFWSEVKSKSKCRYSRKTEKDSLKNEFVGRF